MAITLTNTQSHSSALPLFANTFSGFHSSQKASPIPSLQSRPIDFHFSQSKRHPSLPPRPPVVVSTSTADTIDGLPRCPTGVDRAFNDLVPATRGMESSDVKPPVCAIVKDYSDDNHTRESLCPSTAIATYADLPPPSTRGQSRSPGLSATGNRVDHRRGSHHEPVQGQATSLGCDAIRDQSTFIPASILNDFDSYLSKKQFSASITSDVSSPDNNLRTLSVRDGVVDCEVGGRPPKRSKTELDRCYLERSNHGLAQSPSVVPESEDLGSDTGDSESESESDADVLQDLGDRWVYRRILDRRIDPSGRREVLLEWEPTWEVEDALDDLKRALRRYAKERWESQKSARRSCSNRGTKKRKHGE